jgi:hypothetical protein
MPVTLFNLAGPAIFAWLVLIFAPTTRLARWLGETALGPVYLAVLYFLGVAPLMIEGGAGVMRDFGTAEGVTKLLATQDVALVAWIHILVFDQLVGLFIYRDNIKHRYVSLPMQSVLLFVTLMFGPVGFLGYYVLRWVRKVRPYATQPVPGIATQRDAIESVRWLFRHERALIAAGVSGVVLGLVAYAIILQRGTPLVPPGGDLRKAASFCTAVGLYVLTLVPLMPAAGVSPRLRRVLVAWVVGAMLYSFPVEIVQVLRGIDPRFNNASAPDQIAGGLFFLVALSLIVHFFILAGRFFGRTHAIRNETMLLAVRYGIVAVSIGFVAGFWMSAVQGRAVAPAGSILPLHAIGFHGMQAIPFIALLLVWGNIAAPAALRAVHVAGAAWLAAALAIAIQTAQGKPAGEPGALSALSVLLLLVVASVGIWAAFRWLRGKDRLLIARA